MAISKDVPGASNWPSRGFEQTNPATNPADGNDHHKYPTAHLIPSSILQLLSGSFKSRRLTRIPGTLPLCGSLHWLFSIRQFFTRDSQRCAFSLGLTASLSYPGHSGQKHRAFQFSQPRSLGIWIWTDGDHPSWEEINSTSKMDVQARVPSEGTIWARTWKNEWGFCRRPTKWKLLGSEEEHNRHMGKVLRTSTSESLLHVGWVADTGGDKGGVAIGPMRTATVSGNLGRTVQVVVLRVAGNPTWGGWGKVPVRLGLSGTWQASLQLGTGVCGDTVLLCCYCFKIMKLDSRKNVLWWRTGCVVLSETSLKAHLPWGYRLQLKDLSWPSCTVELVGRQKFDSWQGKPPPLPHPCRLSSRF